MLRRVALVFAIALLLSSTAFALPNGCNSYDCYTDGTNDFCWQYLNGGGFYQGCVTVRQCNGARECIMYCNSTTCYWV